MKNITSITKALADETRLRILAMLKNRELCVCEITAVLELAPSTISKHLSILEQSGLISTRKKGRWVHCSIAAKPAPQTRTALNWISQALQGTETSVKDGKKLVRIHKLKCGGL